VSVSSDSASLRRVVSAVGVETWAVNHATPGYRLSAAAVGAVLRGISNFTAAGAWRSSKTSAG